MLNNDIIAKANDDLKDIEKKLWIQAYVSRKENPLIDLIGSVLLLICSYLAFYQYFSKGVGFSFLTHAVAFITVTICIVISHRYLNSYFTDKAKKLCPIATPDFSTQKISSIEQLYEINSRNHFTKDKIYYSGPLTALFSIVSLILCFVWFANLQKLPVPPGCTLYLVVMCILTSTWFFFVGLLASQSLLLPLSPEVRTAVRKYKKEKKAEAKLLRLAELEKAKLEQQEKMLAEAKVKQKAEDEQQHKVKDTSNLHPDLPNYEQYDKEAQTSYDSYYYTNALTTDSYTDKDHDDFDAIDKSLSQEGIFDSSPVDFTTDV